MENVLNIFLLRGLPGAGKSSLAAILSEAAQYPVFSVDDYFTDASNGEYNFKFDENHLAYQSCIDRTEMSMQSKCSKIFIANTFTMDWEIAPYFKLAATYNYQLFVMTVEKHHEAKNCHGVSDEQLERMAEKYKVKLF